MITGLYKNERPHLPEGSAIVEGVKRFRNFEEARKEAVKHSYSLMASLLPAALGGPAGFEEFYESWSKVLDWKKEWCIPSVGEEYIYLEDWGIDYGKRFRAAHVYHYSTCSGKAQFLWDNTHKILVLRFETRNLRESKSLSFLMKKGYNVTYWG